MPVTREADAARLRLLLADRLQASDDLRTPAWREAVLEVPREAFLGGRIYRRLDTPGATLWEQITPENVGRERWLELAYENTTWVTQLDGRDVVAAGSEPVQGAPTSSSTLPGLVVSMLEDLQVAEGNSVLEVGTGTGYSTALLCQRLGDERVTSMEIDRQVAARARSTLAAVGYTPRLLTDDGLGGHVRHAPYDRIVATCSVRAIPRSWIEQTRVGGTILTALSGWLFGSGLARVQVTEPGVAQGRFLPGTISFMPARPHTPVSLSQLPGRDGDTTATQLGPKVLDDWTMRWLAQLALPGARSVSVYPDKHMSDTPSHLLVDDDGSAVWLQQAPDGQWTATQSGPRRIWDLIEETITIWRDAGSPAQRDFTVTITQDGQHVAHPGIDRTWELPT